MAIQGKQPWEILKKCIDDCNYTLEMIANATGASKSTISKMTRDTDYAKGIINARYLEFLEACGKDIEIHVIRREKNPMGIREHMSLADQLQLDYRNHRKRLLLESRSAARKYRDKRNLMYKDIIEHPEKHIDDEDTYCTTVKKQSSGKKHKNELSETEKQIKKTLSEERRKESKRIAQKKWRETEGKKTTKAKPGSKTKKEL